MENVYSQTVDGGVKEGNTSSQTSDFQKSFATTGSWAASLVRVKCAEYSGASASAKGLKATGLVAAGSRYVPVFLLNKQGITAGATVVVSRGSAWRRDTGNDPRINICKCREAARCCDVAELIGLQPAEENKKTSSNVNESRW